MLSWKNWEMSDVNATFLYSVIGRVHFDGTRDALDFINIIELWIRIGDTYYPMIMIVKLLV